jgi:hypothetical protein
MLAADDQGDPQAQRLERMRSEFLAAQQRRRQSAPPPATRPDHTDDGPLLEDPAAGTPTATVAVTP